MDNGAALEIIDEAMAIIDEFHAVCPTQDLNGRAFKQWWGESLLIEQERVVPQLGLARQIAAHIGAVDISIADAPDKGMNTSRPFGANRHALVVLRTRIAEQERLESILGATGPQLSTSSLHPTIWDAAAQFFRRQGPHLSPQQRTARQTLSEAH
jgi:hypothetical protein